MVIRSRLLEALVSLLVVIAANHYGFVVASPILEPQSISSASSTSLGNSRFEGVVQDFRYLVSQVEPAALHEALHDFLPQKYSHGMFKDDRDAMEAIHSEEPKVATGIIKMAALAKRQSNGTMPSPGTSISVATVTAAPVVATSTPEVTSIAPVPASAVSNTMPVTVTAESKGAAPAPESPIVTPSPPQPTPSPDSPSPASPSPDSPSPDSTVPATALAPAPAPADQESSTSEANDMPITSAPQAADAAAATSSVSQGQVLTSTDAQGKTIITTVGGGATTITPSGFISAQMTGSESSSDMSTVTSSSDQGQGQSQGTLTTIIHATTLPDGSQSTVTAVTVVGAGGDEPTPTGTAGVQATPSRTGGGQPGLQTGEAALTRGLGREISVVLGAAVGIAVLL